MILRCPSIRKCANFLFLFFFKFFDCLSDFLNDHLGNVAGGRTENGDYGIGVEIEDMLEVLTGEILMRIIACTGKSHKSDATFERVFSHTSRLVSSKSSKKLSALTAFRSER